MGGIWQEGVGRGDSAVGDGAEVCGSGGAGKGGIATVSPGGGGSGGAPGGGGKPGIGGGGNGGCFDLFFRLPKVSPICRG